MIEHSLNIRIWKIFYTSLIVLLGMSSHGAAKDFYRIGEDYRSLAMGNTGITSANNSYTLFYNPAALANIFSWWIDFPMVQVIFSEDAEDLYETMSTGLKLKTQEERYNFMEDNFGKNPFIRIHTGINGMANMDKKGFTIGGNYVYEFLVDIEVRNRSAPEIISLERLDVIKQAGFSYPIGLGKLVFGIGYRQIDRKELGYTYDFIDAANQKPFPEFEDDGIQATGSAYDVGFIYRTATIAHVMWGAVWRNEIKFQKEGVTDIPSQLDLGISMRQDSVSFRWVLAMDVRDVTRNLGSQDPDAGDKSWNRRIHLGTELGFLPIDKSSSVFSARVGYNAGYLTYGAEIALSRVLVAGYTKYIEETGEYGGQKPSPRTVVYVSLGF